VAISVGSSSSAIAFRSEWGHFFLCFGCRVTLGREFCTPAFFSSLMDSAFPKRDSPPTRLLFIGVCVFLVWIALEVTSKSGGAILGWVSIRIAVREFRSLGNKLFFKFFETN
jgi:hypothetical protein